MAPLAGRYVVAFKDPLTGDLVKTMTLNRSAGEMLQLFLEGNDIMSIAAILSERYGVPKERITRDVTQLFLTLGLPTQP